MSVLGVGPFSAQIERAIRALLSGGTSGSTVFTGSVTATRYLAGDGTAAAPAYSFTSQPSTGFRSEGADGAVRYVATGSDVARFSSLTNYPLVLAGGLGLAGTGSFTSPDVRMIGIAANAMRLGNTTGVTLRWATDGLLEVRNFANSAEATLRVLQVSTATAASVIASRVALTNGAGVGGGTLLNAPAAGNPTKWIGIDDNGTIRYVPAW